MIRFITTMAMALVLATPASAKWLYHVNKDEFDDKKTYIAAVIGKKKSLLHSIPMISIFCSKSGSPMLTLNPGPYLGNDAFADIKLRIDDLPALEFSGLAPAGMPHTVAIISPEASLIRSMRAGSRIRIRVYDYQSNAHDASFTLSGFTAATNKLAAHCNMPRGWNEPEAPKILAKENWIP